MVHQVNIKITKILAIFITIFVIMASKLNDIFLQQAMVKWSPCDGIGGTVKHLAARANLQNTHILSVRDMFDWCIKNI